MLKKCNFIETVGDWHGPYIDYLKNGVLLTIYNDARQLKWRAQRFFMNGNDLFQISFAGKSLKCVYPADIHPLLEKYMVEAVENMKEVGNSTRNS